MLRSAPGGYVYHVTNRASGRLRLFRNQADYLAFEQVLLDACQRQPMRILGYCFMPDHWHLILWPKRDGDLTTFIRWLTLTHAQRWKTAHSAVGQGHLYQGRFKNFPIEQGAALLSALRFVESTPVREKEIKRVEKWKWASAFVRQDAGHALFGILSDWPIERPRRWLEQLNEPQDKAEINTLELHIRRGRPLGEEGWIKRTVKSLHLEQTVRARGRPLTEEGRLKRIAKALRLQQMKRPRGRPRLDGKPAGSVKPAARKPAKARRSRAKAK